MKSKFGSKIDVEIHAQNSELLGRLRELLATEAPFLVFKRQGQVTYAFYSHLFKKQFLEFVEVGGVSRHFNESLVRQVAAPEERWLSDELYCEPSHHRANIHGINEIKLTVSNISSRIENGSKRHESVSYRFEYLDVY